MSDDAGVIELRLRERVRTLIRTSPELSAEYELARRARRPSLAKILFLALAVCIGGPMLFAGVPYFLLLFYERIGGLEFALAAWSLWAVAVMFCVADGVLRTIWLSPLARLLKHLPVDDGLIVRRAIRECVSWSALGMLAGAWGFGFVAWRKGLPPAAWFIAALFLLLQWVIAAATGVAIARFRPRSWYQTAAALTMLSMMFAVFLIAAPANARPAITHGLYALTPSGWAAGAWMQGYLQGDPWGWLGLPPAGLMLLLFFKALREWPQRHTAIESASRRPTTPPAQATEGENVCSSFSWSVWLRWLRGDWIAQGEYSATASAIADRIRSRAFLEPQQVFRLGPFGRIYRWTLSPREQIIAAWFVGDVPTLNDVGKTTLLTVGCLIAWNAVLGLRFPCLVMLSIAGLTMFYADRWRGFGKGGIPGDYLPCYAFVPVGYAEIASLICKLSLIQCLQMVPAFFLAAAADSVIFGMAADRVAAGAIVIATLCCAAATFRPLAYVAAASNLLGMPWRRTYWTVALLAFGSVAGVAALFEIASLAVVGNPAATLQIAAICAMILFAALYGLSRVCLWIESQGYCDLTSKAASALQVKQENGRIRLRNRRVQRLKYGAFWWLPRNMHAEINAGCPQRTGKYAET